MARLLGLFLVFGLAMAVVAAGSPSPVGPQAVCESDLQQLIQNCKQYVMFPANPKIAPSDACCGVVHHVDVSCLCAKITPEVEKIVCMEKVVYVANYCKRPLAHGYKCGSYTVPGAVA